MPEGRRIFANLSVEENLKVPLERDGPWTIERIYQLFPRLEERKPNRGRQLSGGEQEMLSIGRALLLNPRLLILDEPSQGLAPLIVREVFRIVQQMKAEGISVLLVEQNARMSLEIADDAYVLDDGIVVYSGTASGTRRRRGARPGARRRQRRGMDADVRRGRHEQRRWNCSVPSSPMRSSPLPPRSGGEGSGRGSLRAFSLSWQHRTC